METEWQLIAVALGPVKSWITRHSGDFGLVVDAGGRREQTDTYLDTEDWAFFRAGYSFRFRQAHHQCEATFKSLSGPGPLQCRREVRQRVESPEPQCLVQSPGLASEWFVSLAGDRPVRTLFQVRTRRQTLLLRQGLQGMAEVALDHSTLTVPHKPKATSLLMVELEGERISAPDLVAYVQALQTGCALLPARGTKFDTGLLAGDYQPLAWPEVGPLDAVPGLSMGEFVFIVLRAQFREFLKYESGTRLGEDNEDLHQMRVATRRLRVAMRIFRDDLPARVQTYRTTLKWIGQAQGGVRDLDVKMEQLDEWWNEAEEPDRQAFADIGEALRRNRSQARARLLRVLNSRRYARWVRSFREFLQRGAIHRAANQPLAQEGLPRVIKPLRNQVLRAGKVTKQPSLPEHYHRLRIRCKRLRYALEFASQLDPETQKPLRKRLVRLQDLLGDYHDAAVAIRYLRGLLEENASRLPAHALFTLGKMEERYRRKAADCLADLPKRFRRLRSCC